MKNLAVILILLVVISSCKPRIDTDKQLFTLLPSSSTKIDFVNRLKETGQENIIEYLYFNNGAGVAAGDINNDGLIDLYFTSNQGPNKLYLNKGNLLFEDITEAAGVAGTGNWKTGVTMADVNGDGLLDIYVCEVGNYKSFHGKNQLFINKGNLRFKDEAHNYGLDFEGFSTQAAFFDYDLDGDLDMYLLNHSVHTSRSYGNAALRNDVDARAGDRLFRNEGNGVFKDVTREAGIYSSQIGYGLGISTGDINNDGYPDIYISNDFHENDYLYINNRNGTFTERLTECISHTSRSSMGNDIGDFNNDGLLDIMVLDMMPDVEKIRKQSGGEDDYELFNLKREYGYNYQYARNTLQLNLGAGLFSETGLLAGVYSTDWSWSPLFCDVDNDGWKDLFITNGIYRRANDLDYVKFLTGGSRYSVSSDVSKLSDRELYEKMPLYPNVNYIYKNNKDLTFTNMAGEWGFNRRSYSNGAVYADLDNDGDLDLVVNNINENAFVYRNNAVQQKRNNYLSVVLRGRNPNINGIGSRVSIFCNGIRQIAEQFSTRGFMSSATGPLHFGLGQGTVIDSLVVRWPDMSVQTIKNIPANNTVTLHIENAVMQKTEPENENENLKLFITSQIPGLQYRHIEDPYSDFEREHLIPHSLSNEGPALATGDINGDRLDDIFIGGAKGGESGIFVQQKGGSFKKSDVPFFRETHSADDVDALFFDADGDGDSDLYIVRGGNEFPAGSRYLSDVLLINSGNGRFLKCDAGSLPRMSHNGSCIRACDFDNDGDQDLFVGSRSVPGAYGISPDQYLLENDGHGHFRDITDSAAPELRKSGMVTDACWVDYDGDGDKDLVITGEWMKIRIFRNDKNHFSDVTEEAGLGETSGWWNCIKAADIDGDGDMDLIGGNLGRNSMLKASVREPVEMYINDFDNNGSPDQVICSFEGGVSYPVASLDELMEQITGLEKKFPHYSDFGGKRIEDIFGRNTVEQSEIKKAVLLESCLFRNNGNGTFNVEKLPVEAQFSPVRDIIADDFNKNGIKDLVIAGNDYQVRPSLGRYDGSYGWILEGKPDGSFKAMMPSESGLIIKGDARKIIPMKIGGKHHIISGVNNSDIVVFKTVK